MPPAAHLVDLLGPLQLVLQCWFLCGLLAFRSTVAKSGFGAGGVGRDTVCVLTGELYPTVATFDMRLSR